MPFASGNVYSYTPTQVNSRAARPPSQPASSTVVNSVPSRVCVCFQMVGTILTTFSVFVFGVSTLISSNGASAKKVALAATDAQESAK